MDKNKKELLKKVLLAQAIGDAFGFFIEFKSWEDWKWAASQSKKSKVILSRKTKPQSGSKSNDSKSCTVDRLN